MDPNTLVLEISSDEDAGSNNNRRGVSIRHSKKLKSKSKSKSRTRLKSSVEELFGDVYHGAEKPWKKLKLKSNLKSSSVDDDCVVLDIDPNEAVEVQNDNNPGNGDGDVLVLSEKGQVACRDYPHSRHLCIKFPFLTTPNRSHCNQCYCYVCDARAPCVYWGNVTATTDHCRATDRNEFWKLQRKTVKNSSKIVHPAPPLAQAHIPNPGWIHTHKKYNLGPRVHRPVFKRTSSVRVARMGAVRVGPTGAVRVAQTGDAVRVARKRTGDAVRVAQAGAVRAHEQVMQLGLHENEQVVGLGLHQQQGKTHTGAIWETTVDLYNQMHVLIINNLKSPIIHLSQVIMFLPNLKLMKVRV